MKIQKGRARKRRGARLRCGGLGGAGIAAAADCELMDVWARCGRFQEEECWLQQQEEQEQEEQGGQWALEVCCCCCCCCVKGVKAMGCAFQ